jgi:diadenosine tetraphosphate (Ap4A) HIT family hydrolase
MVNTNIKNNNCDFCFPPEKDNQFLLCKTQYWHIYLANNQNYPGRCIISLNRHCSSLSETTEQEILELHKIIQLLENIYKKVLNATNFNWTCLMNGGYSQKPYNPHVHFHFIPRYEAVYPTQNGDFKDINFGHHYSLDDEFQALNYEERIELHQKLKKQINKELNRRKMSNDYVCCFI